MAETRSLQLPATPRVFQYLAVPTDDKGLAEAATACQHTLRWAPAERDKSTQKDWHAYQNLLQLTGILSTAGIGNATKVWDSVVEFVETKDMVAVPLPPEQPAKGAFTSAKELLTNERVPEQSLAPVGTPTKPESCAGVLPTQDDPKVPLSPEQLERIAKNREHAMAVKQLKQNQQELEQALATGAPPLKGPPAPQQLPRL